MSTKRRQRTAEQNKLTIPEDGLIDDLAVTLVVTGERIVKLTPTERDLATVGMIKSGLGFKEIAERLATHNQNMHKVLTRLGYKTISEHGGKYTPKRIVEIDYVPQAPVITAGLYQGDRRS